MPPKRRKRGGSNPWPALAAAAAMIVLGVWYFGVERGGTDSTTTPSGPSGAAQATLSAEETSMAAKKSPTKTKTKTRTPTKTPTRKPSATKQTTKTRTPTRKATPSAAAQGTQGAGDAQQVLEAVNRYRAAQGRAALAWDNRLAAFAQSRAEDMIARDYFSHYDPKTGELILGQLGSRTANGETLYQLQGGVAAYLSKIDDMAVADWKKSAAHAEIMGDKKMTRGGVGVAASSRRVVVVLIVEQ